MIIGLFTLLALLFFGSPDQVFLIDSMDKGIKKQMEKGEEKDVLLTSIKEHKKSMKSYYKELGKLRKEYKKVLIDESEDLESYHVRVAELNHEMQQKAIATRIEVTNALTDEVWTKITEVKEKEKKKEKKKIQKAREKLKTHYQKLNAFILEGDPKSELIKYLNQIEIDHIAYLDRFDSNSINSIVLDKDAQRSELEGVAAELNELLKNLSSDVLAFEKALDEKTTVEQKAKIVKRFSKLF